MEYKGCFSMVYADSSWCRFPISSDKNVLFPGTGRTPFSWEIYALLFGQKGQTALPASAVSQLLAV